MKITVVIPCRNEVNYIKECIDAIYNSVVPEDYEISVFVVDGLSNDGTIKIINNLSEKYTSLQIIDNKKQLTPFAFNLGIHAGGPVDYVQIIGARQIVSADYIYKAISIFLENKDVWCVGGRVHNEYLNETGKNISKAMSNSFGMGLGNFRTLEKSGYVDTVGTPMYPYWVFEKIGFFDEELIRNQDDDFNFRVIKAGGKVYYEHGISVKYYVRGDFDGLQRQFFQYGYWKVYVNKKHKAVTTFRQLIPPLFVLYLMGAVFAPIIDDSFAIIYTMPITAYIIICIVKGFQLGEKQREIWEIVWGFMSMHVSYGLGYLYGVLHFLILGKKPSANQKRLSR